MPDTSGPPFTKSEMAAGEQARKEAEADSQKFATKDAKEAREAAEAKAKSDKEAKEVAEKQAAEAEKKAAEVRAADEKRRAEAKASEARVEAKVKENCAAKEKDAAACLEGAQVVLKEYGGLESNIPAQSEYWGLMNRYRALVSK